MPHQFASSFFPAPVVGSQVGIEVEDPRSLDEGMAQVV